MTDNKNLLETEALKTAAKPAMPMWIEYGPILIYVVLYTILRRGADPETAILKAATVFMIAAVIAMIYAWRKIGRISLILGMTTVFIVIAVGLSVFTGNPIFFFMKPTIVNILFGIACIGGVLVGKNGLKLLMGEAYAMPEKAWNTFAIRWGLFFFAMAAVNEIVWRNFSEDFWSYFKLFGFLPLTLVFILTQMPFLLKHSDLKSRMNDAGKD
ncbi:inner membrane-spanning protein YciB [Robiginitomaculum antarcticum]|uniref:inner membrane-spanning protein YciB n=1 Tax=Robiginitomaculum antarcticum TaxID=437507 RepID=UPI0003805475|nr:inner membrane-spanning protein YciB [Robiginitomaculum antarcticum]